MRRLSFIYLLALMTLPAVAQHSPQSTTSDAQAVTLAQQAVVALTGGAAITDVTLSANVTSISGSDSETGTGMLKAKGTSESRIDLNLSSGTQSDVRNSSAGSWQKNGAAPVNHAAHNCLTDAAWFFPALSSLSAVANGTTTYRTLYIGQESLYGHSVQHITISQPTSSPDAAAVQAIAHLSSIEWYLDTATALPVAVRFTMHPEDNASVDLPIEVRFSNYQSSNGILVPFHVQKYLNNGLVLDLSINSVALNTGLPDSDFTLQ